MSTATDTVVLLIFKDGNKTFLEGTHIHGVRDGQVLVAANPPGAGLGADIVRQVALSDLVSAETCSADTMPDDPSTGPAWRMGWGERQAPPAAPPRDSPGAR